MSFRKEPNVLVSGVLGAAAGFAIVGGLVVLLQIPAQAQRTPSPIGVHQDSATTSTNIASE